MPASNFAFIRETRAAFKQRFDAFDGRLDAWRDRHRPILGVLGTVLCFVLLFGGVVVHAYESDFARALAVQCLDAPGAEGAAAILCGWAAILFVKVFARLTSQAQRVFIDPFKFVRPEPPGTNVPFWVRAMHVLLGIVLFVSMSGWAQSDRNVINLGDYGVLALLLGWWIGGRGVLRFFWAKLPRGGGWHAHAANARRKYESDLKTKGIVNEP